MRADPWGFGSDTEQHPEPDASTIEGLTALIDKQAALLIDVSTGGRQIKTVNNVYQANRRLLNSALKSRHVKPPFPWDGVTRKSWTRPAYAALSSVEASNSLCSWLTGVR